MSKKVPSTTPPSYRELVSQAFQSRVDRNPKYSLRAFARSLCIDSGALTQILNGKRIPSAKAAQKIVQHLELSPLAEKNFLLSLAETHAARKLKRARPYFQEILKQRRDAPPLNQTETLQAKYVDLSLDHFRTISDWYHYAILELTLTKGFQSSPRWIAAQLGISVTEVNLACIRLRKLGYLKTEKGRPIKTVAPLLTGDRQRTSAAHKKRQKQVLEKAITALEEVPIEFRNHTAMTMAIDPRKIPQAKVFIQKFLDDLSSLLESGQQETVYEASVCLYPLQKMDFRKENQ
jgi:uncharacterized protein (TIGR02147 family)